jgi:hypothetical protein
VLTHLKRESSIALWLAGLKTGCSLLPNQIEMFRPPEPPAHQQEALH